MLPVGDLSLFPFCEAQALSRASFCSPCCFPDTFLFIPPLPLQQPSSEVFAPCKVQLFCAAQRSLPLWPYLILCSHLERFSWHRLTPYELWKSFPIHLSQGYNSVPALALQSCCLFASFCTWFFPFPHINLSLLRFYPTLNRQEAQMAWCRFLVLLSGFFLLFNFYSSLNSSV